MMSEPTRRAAMEAARRSGAAALSGRVQLVQEIEAVKQPGFLVYLPLYRGRTADAGETASINDHYGWVYSPLRAYDMFGAVLAAEDLGGTVVEIYDEAADEERLLYRTAPIGTSPERLAERRIETAGREWLVRVAPGEGFEGRSPLPLIVAIGGVLISLLIAALMSEQVRGRARTEREVALRTAELTAANLRMHAEAEARATAEAQVRQMQKMEAIGQLTGGIAHDFNNMLAVVIGNLDMVERGLGDTERVRRAIRNARAGAEKAAVLTSRLLAFGRQQALSPRVLDPNRLVAGMSELLRRTLGEKVRLETDLADGAWPVRVDSSQLENAILNLAINGRDAMPDGGVLTIATVNTTGEDSDHVVIRVADTGHGMASEVIERAVDPFFTTKEVGRGTGLGLSQVFGFVTQSGGLFQLRSEVGTGTVAEIWLPRHAGSAPLAEEMEEELAELPRARAGEKVLVVEDEEQVRELSASGLRELGYEVVEAANGVEALALLDDGTDVDLLFTDMVMPEMSGDRLARDALARRPSLRLLFTTGYSRDVVDGSGEGLALLQKPFTLAQLALRVRQELDRAV
jgi:signal transduction histidine kinase